MYVASVPVTYVAVGFGWCDSIAGLFLFMYRLLPGTSPRLPHLPHVTYAICGRGLLGDGRGCLSGPLPPSERGRTLLLLCLCASCVAPSLSVYDVDRTPSAIQKLEAGNGFLYAFCYGGRFCLSRVRA